MRLVLKLLVVFLVLGSLQSCVSKKKYDELLASKEATDQALAQTQDQVKTLQGDMESLKTSMEDQKKDYDSKIAGLNSDLKMKDGKISEVEGKLTATQEELDMVKKEINGIFSAYQASGLSLEERDGNLFVVTSTPMKFRSGSSYLSKEERDAISSLAETLKNNPKIQILVEGHTDDKKFIAGAGMDNWDLSVKRAKSVVTRLIKEGVDPSQLAISGKGENDPAADNESADGRATNRRAVVKPNPSLSGLKNIGGN